jgi:3-deoxy-D-manno-octulosonic-acid transferase
MAYSLGLTLYNLRPAKAGLPLPERPPRPAGRLIWLHVPGPDALRSAAELARRMVDDDGVTVLMTGTHAPPPRDGVVLQPPPTDTPAEARAFLDHWRPEVAIFAEGEMRPAIVHECAARKLPVMLVDGRAPYVLRERDGWFPGLLRTVLSSFSHVLTVDEAAARAFRKAGAPPAAVTAVGRMEEQSAALSAPEAERAVLAQDLMARPVWFAASLPEAEEDAIIAAHRACLSYAHRLLLIVAPENPARAEALAARMEAGEGWIVARRSLDESPDPDVEVYIADSPGDPGSGDCGPGDYGLWYRLAPVTFLGGSLSGGGAIRNPMEPAALGSAILYGPRAGAFGPACGRLGAARAARVIGSAADLAEALADLLSPDRAARLAHAAWTVTSEGAEATAHAVTMIRRLMDGEG